MNARLIQDVVNKYSDQRKTEIPLTEDERREFVKSHLRGTPVPETKWVTQPVFYGRKDDLLEVYLSTNLERFGPDKLDIFILISKAGERFIVKRDLITIQQ